MPHHASIRELFLRHQAQTSEAPAGLEIIQAQGANLTDKEGKTYWDAISGISVCQLGHGHPEVTKAIHEQVDRYMHLMVYGEIIQAPQVLFASALASCLPESLSCVYFTNSGSEATEGAMKLAKRVTRRSRIVSFRQSYHGSTQGALSLMENEYWQQAYRPLLPGIDSADYMDPKAIELIGADTACVILEPVQAEAGVIVPDTNWLQQIKQRCQETGALLVFDEIQTGFGRTGSLFRFQQIGVVPDILLLGKALGGGMPLGAFISSHAHMHQLAHDPVLGHITTFGGHPVSCAAGHAALRVLLADKLIERVKRLEQLVHQYLVHPLIQKITSCGLLMAVHFENESINQQVIREAMQLGVFTDWFLFAPQALRLAPPLIVQEEEMKIICRHLLEAIQKVSEQVTQG